MCPADPIGPKPGEVIPVRGFQISITAPSPEFGGGIPIETESSIKNVTEKAHSLLHYPALKSYRIEVTTAKGEAVPFTRYGHIQYEGWTLPRSTGPLDFAAGEEYKRTLVLSRIYDMTETGTYLVKVKQKIRTEADNDFMDVTSNILTIVVR